jgi:hypothetical protein
MLELLGLIGFCCVIVGPFLLMNEFHNKKNNKPDSEGRFYKGGSKIE